MEVMIYRGFGIVYVRFCVDNNRLIAMPIFYGHACRILVYFGIIAYEEYFERDLHYIFFPKSVTVALFFLLRVHAIW